jgi:spore coat-associated protein N
MKTQTDSILKVSIVGFVLVGSISLISSAVFSALSASAFNASAQPISSGTLSLTYADVGAGFGTAITGIAPGDTVNRFIALTNGGTLAGKDLTLRISAAASNILTTDAAKGLQMSVTGCTVPWTPATGVCSGTTVALLGSTPAPTLIATPQTLVSAVSAGETLNLRIGISLPDATETTTNGVPPVGTVQGLTANITWTFNEVQRTALIVNS